MTRWSVDNGRARYNSAGRTENPFQTLSIDLILLPSRSGEEAGAERCGASLETDDQAWAVCNATLGVALCAAPASSLAACRTPRRIAKSAAHGR